MCMESSRFGPRNRASLQILHEKPGRPAINSPKKVLNLCSKCLNTISPGFPHTCSKTSLVNNSQFLLARKRSIEPVVCSEILRKFRSASEDSRITLPRPSGGHPIHMLPGNLDQLPQHKMPKMDFSDIAQIKCTGGAMSNKQLKAVTKVIRDAGLACPSMKDYYDERKQYCDDIFECVQLDLEWSKEKYSSDIRKTWVVRCCNIDKLIEKVYNISGESSVYRFNFKLGLDYGCGFTKLVMCLQLENSVRNLIFLWVSSAPENNYNFSIILNAPEIQKFIHEYNVSFTFDLKAAALCLGIMLGRYPCISCEWDAKSGLDHVEFKSRSSAHHAEMYQKLCEEYNSDSKNQAIDCDGVEDMEALGVWMVDYMQMFNIPELHLLLGVGQKLYNAIVATMSEEELVTHELLLKHNNISRSSYHGGAFEGNAMRKITLMVEQIGFPISNSSSIALKRFSEVVRTCFGQKIQGDYKLAIFQFEEAFKLTGLNCSTKVHIVCRHVIPFITKFLPVGMGLGAVSEQAAESAHSRFIKVWRNYQCSESLENYGENLLNAVKEINLVNFIST
ncbi:hypothetical protein LOD99_14221 [Oopsacas minuta]|uniref:Uncharacterized protein n=1 Tax=Oopsacas minuta TaxID=111878 RepID=A0AAV7KFN9_9METZ|nr:hypothetical protein LOD99_14221 [Oopsacas minuta]